MTAKLVIVLALVCAVQANGLWDSMLEKMVTNMEDRADALSAHLDQVADEHMHKAQMDSEQNMDEWMSGVQGLIDEATTMGRIDEVKKCLNQNKETLSALSEAYSRRNKLCVTRQKSEVSNSIQKVKDSNNRAREAIKYAIEHVKQNCHDGSIIENTKCTAQAYARAVSDVTRITLETTKLAAKAVLEIIAFPGKVTMCFGSSTKEYAVRVQQALGDLATCIKNGVFGQ